MKRNAGGRSSFGLGKSPKSSKKPETPTTPLKTKKKSVDSPRLSATSRLSSEPPQSTPPRSPKGFLRGLRRSSSKTRNKTADGNDMQAETSSISSLPIHSLDETNESSGRTTPNISPAKSSNTSADTSIAIVMNANGNDSITPLHTSSPVRVTLRNKPSPYSAHRKTTDSAVFKEGSFEPLFGDDDSNLFGSSELAALLGKKREKTPEKTLESNKGEDTPDVGTSPSHASTPKSQPKTNGFLTDTSSSLSVEKGKTCLNSPNLGIKARLDRYASNSKITKDPSLTLSSSSSPSSSSSTSVKKDPALEDKVEDKVQKKSTLLFEEDISQPAKKTEDQDEKAKDKAENKTPVKSTLLFEDDDSDIFAPAKKSEDTKTSLFGEKLFDDVSHKKDPLTDQNANNFGVKETEDKAKKGPQDLFGDPLDNSADLTTSADTKKDSDGDLKNGLFGEPLFDEETKSTTKHSTLFDDDDDSTLFSSKRRKEKKPLDSGSDSLFNDADSEIKVSQIETLPEVENPSITTAATADPLGVITEPKKSEAEPCASGETLPDIVINSKPTEEDNVPKPSPSETSPSKKDADNKPPARKEPPPKPVLKVKPTLRDNKTKVGGNGDDKKPSWMAELKKRKQGKEGEVATAPPPAAKKEPREAPVPEWQKKALERKKKAEAAKFGGSTVKTSEKKSPTISSQSTKPEEKLKTDSTSTDKLSEAVDAKKSGTELKGGDNSVRNDTGSNSPSPGTRYKTRKQREREEKEQEEKARKEQQEKEKKIEEKEKEQNQEQDVDSKDQEDKQEDEPKKPEVDQDDKPKKQEDKQEDEPKKPEVDQDDKPKKQEDKQEDEPKKQEVDQDDKPKKQEDKQENEPKKHEEVDQEDKPKEKEEKKAALKDDSEITTTEEDKPKENGEKKGVHISDTKSRYKTKREREQEEREKEKKKLENDQEKEDTKRKSKTGELEKTEKYQIKETENGETTKIRYKTRREREREAKEKEENERLAKEDHTKATTDKATTSSSKPLLPSKPSIEIVIRKSRSTSKSSQASDDKSSQASDDKSSTVNKDENHIEDDVFNATTESTEEKSPKHSKAIVLDSVPDGKKSDDEKLTVKAEKKDSVSSSSSSVPLQPGEVRSAISSVSSERDGDETTKSYRSHSQSLSTSRSPTPPISGTTKDSVPEWKKKLMERKKSGSSPVHVSPPRKVELPNAEPNVPQWKKNLLAKKKTKGDEKVRKVI